jgi:hypothetical protein
LSPARSHFIEEHLNIFPLNWARVVFALDQNQKVHPQLTKANSNIDAILPFGASYQFLVLYAEVWEVASGFGKQIKDQSLESGAVDSRPVITGEFEWQIYT